jgi:hypothetical protein
VVARPSILSSRIGPLRHVQRSAAKRPLALLCQIRIVPLELSNQRPERPNELQQDGIDAQHDELLSLPPRTARGGSTLPPPPRAGAVQAASEASTARSRAQARTLSISCEITRRAEHGEHGPGLDSSEHEGTLRSPERALPLSPARSLPRSPSPSPAPPLPLSATAPPTRPRSPPAAP